MKSSRITTKMMILLSLLAIGWGYWAYSHAAVERSIQYEVQVPPYESDMARMINAYENLSSQYHTLVQQNLSMMDANDRMILLKLEVLEKKIDELAKKVDKLSAPKPAQPKP